MSMREVSSFSRGASAVMGREYLAVNPNVGMGLLVTGSG